MTIPVKVENLKQRNRSSLTTEQRRARIDKLKAELAEHNRKLHEGTFDPTVDLNFKVHVL